MKKEDRGALVFFVVVLFCMWVFGFAIGGMYESNKFTNKYSYINTENADLHNEVARLQSYLEAYDSAMTIYRADMFACGCTPSEFIFTPDGKYFYKTKEWNETEADR